MTLPKIPPRDAAGWPPMCMLPRALRDAIPEHCSARALMVTAMEGTVRNSVNEGGPRVLSKFTLEESGKLDGLFDLWLDLDADSARNLAARLLELAGQAEQLPPVRLY